MQRFRKTIIPLLLFLTLLSLNGAIFAASNTLVINELDYDQASTDTAEFIEIKNVSSNPINLDLFTVNFINGNAGGALSYRSTDLPNVELAAGDYFVICTNAGTVANCDLPIVLASDLIQNGAPDAVGLSLSGALVDTVSYEGNTGSPYTETSGIGLIDDAVGATSISRCADGVDTDVNNVDFQLRPISPGTSNNCPIIIVDDPTALKINEVDYDQIDTDNGEFVELKNVSASSINLDHYVLELVNGDAGGATVSNFFDLPDLSLAPDDYYVICGSAITVPNCDLDVSPDTNLIQNGAPDAVSLRLNGNIVDALSYEGSTLAPYTEGTGTSLEDSNSIPAIGLSRCDDGADTNNNSADFLLRSISPGTSNDCPSGFAIVEIWEIQAAAHLSPYNGQTVQTNDNVVTAVRNNGFYIQTPDARADGSHASSNGILVFTSSTPAVLVGQQVDVRGIVSEFRPGGLSGGGLTITELTNPIVTIDSSNNPLPAISIIGIGGRIPPSAVINDDGTGNVETSGSFDADLDGIDFYESLEGMRVQVNNAIVVGATNDFGETWVVADNGANANLITPRGGILISPADFNPERIQLEDTVYPGLYPQLNVGDKLTTAAIGVVDYGFGNYELLVTEAFTTVAGGLAPEVTSLSGSERDLTVATFNVENLAGNAAPAAFSSRAAQIVNHLGSPDILVLEEIQDNNGEINDSITDASATLNNLIGAIVAAGGPSYQFQQVDPVDDQDGGAPGGNIRVGFLYNPMRVSFVSRPGGSPTTPNSAVCGPNGAELQFSPGRIDPGNPAFSTSRKPLSGEFVFNGETIFVIGLHFNSKGGDNPLFGFNQPPILSSEVQRLQQAQIVNNFVDSLLGCQADASIVVLGDVNDFDYSAVANTLSGGVLHNLMSILPANERYSYVFDGNSQVLDQVLVSQQIFDNLRGYDVVHVNAEFGVQVSDHDPSIMLSQFNSAPIATNDSYMTDEDLVLNVPTALGVLSNDLDKNGDALTVALVSSTSNGLLILNSDGSFSYSPNLNFNGSDSFSYQVCDPLIRCAITTATMTVNPINDQSLISLAQADVNVAEAQVATNLVQASDVDGDTLSLSASIGSLTDNGNGSWSWQFATTDGPAQSQVVLITVDDAHGGSNQASFNLSVTNVAPVANAGSDQTVNRNAVVSLAATWTDPATGFDDLYSWTWDTNGDSLADTNGTAAYGTTVPATASFVVEGSYTLSFTITDKDGANSSDAVVVTVLNQAPVCTAAVPSSAAIWPANHSMVPVSISGITDPEGDAVVISITTIFQDEPVNGAEDGDTGPDAQGIGSNTTLLRSERVGTGNGRVYHISFTASDGHGGTCSGQVLVGVPINQSNQGAAVDDGAIYDSTMP
jgi:predicted extracellular nuclease